MAKSPQLTALLQAIPPHLLPADKEMSRELIDFLFTHGLTSEKRTRDFLIRRQYHTLQTETATLPTQTPQKTPNRTRHLLILSERWGLTPRHIQSILRRKGVVYK